MTSMAALAPLLGAGVLALMVGAFHGRLTPPSAARSLTAALLLVTIAALASVWILSFGFIGHVPALGHLIRWCAPAAAIDGPIPPYVGAPAMALCVFGLVRVTQVMISYRRMRDVRRQPVEVTREDIPVAYTRPGPAGRIVVSTGLISMLTVRELDVVLAHERRMAPTATIGWCSSRGCRRQPCRCCDRWPTVCCSRSSDGRTRRL